MIASACFATESFKPISCEFWHVGDDALSEKLADAVEKAFASSRDFSLSTGKKPGTLIVEIPENAGWKKELLGTKVLYTTEYKSTGERIILRRKGSCWQDELQSCAEQILKGARKAARHLR